MGDKIENLSEYRVILKCEPVSREFQDNKLQVVNQKILEL